MNEGLEMLGTLTLPGVERSVADARRFCQRTLPDHPLLDDLRTCVSEAVTNAVKHSRSGQDGKVTVALLAERGRLVAEVADEGSDGAGPVPRSDPAGVDGRGLWIIDALTAEWDVRREEERTIVRMSFFVGHS